MPTTISWTDETWMVSTGCTKVSSGCTNCFAERLSATRLKHLSQYAEATDERGHWTGKITLIPEALDKPLHWKKPRMIFVDSMSDLFHEDVPLDYLKRVFDTMVRAHWHSFHVLTKRADRLAAVCGELPWPGNVAIGVTVERSDYLWRIDELRNVPAAVRFVSFEPLIQPILWDAVDLTGIEWAIFGGESGPDARPEGPGHSAYSMVSSARSFIFVCRARNVSPFVKQLGSAWAHEKDAKNRKGEDMSEWPLSLRVREWPRRVA